MTPLREYLDRCHSLAILGGTFDPIHYGHLAVAEAVLAKFSPQRILFMPCGQPPHKDENVSAAEHRYQMALLATCDHPFFDVSRLELDKLGASYTVDTARRLVEACPAGAKIFFIIGADSLAHLLTWKDAEILLTLCRFIAVPRPSFNKKQMTEKINEINTKCGSERVILLEMEKIDISSTKIRQRFSEGRSVRSYVPRAVEDYARAFQLYRPSCSFESVKEQLQKRLSPKRFTHTLGVMLEAEKLAKIYGADLEKARWAALLHDCAKEYSTDKKKTLCKQWGIPLDGTDISQVDLTHGPMGAESAKRDYYVNDAEILQAIRYHSTGHKHMTVLDKVIMLADFIEPYREDYPPLAQMRKHAYTDINKALRIGVKYTIKEETEAKNPIHPASYEALKAL